MRTNRVKQLLRAGQPALGTFMALGSTLGAEQLAQLGFDWLVIDQEHGAIDATLTQSLLQALRTTETVPPVRGPENGADWINRALDAPAARHVGSGLSRIRGGSGEGAARREGARHPGRHPFVARTGEGGAREGLPVRRGRIRHLVHGLGRDRRAAGRASETRVALVDPVEFSWSLPCDGDGHWTSTREPLREPT